MHEILIYVVDKDHEDDINSHFPSDNFQITVAHDLDEAVKISAEELFDLVLIWPADFEQTEAFLSALHKNDLSYLPVIALIEKTDQLSNILSLEITDYILLPAPCEEFLTVINGIIMDLDLQSTVMEGMNWQGSLEEYNLIDLFQMIDESKNDAELTFSYKGKNANIYFKEGKLVHAESMNFKGEFALHKLIFWSKGNFQIKFSRQFSVKNSVQSTNQEVLLTLAHDLSEWDQFYRGLPNLFEEMITNPFVESSNISPLQKVMLKKCKDPISIFDLLLELEEDNKTIIQELKKLLETNLIGKKREIESLIIREQQSKGLTKILNTISSIFGKKQDLSEIKEIDESKYIEDDISRIEFEHFHLEEEDKENIIRKIESLN